MGGGKCRHAPQFLVSGPARHRVPHARLLPPPLQARVLEDNRGQRQQRHAHFGAAGERQWVGGTLRPEVGCLTNICGCCPYHGATAAAHPRLQAAHAASGRARATCRVSCRLPLLPTPHRAPMHRPLPAQEVLRELDGIKKCFFRGFWAQRAIRRLEAMQGHAALRGQRCVPAAGWLRRAAAGGMPCWLWLARSLRGTTALVALGCDGVPPSVGGRANTRLPPGCLPVVLNSIVFLPGCPGCREDERYRGQLRRNDGGILDCCLLFRARGAQVGRQGERPHPRDHSLSALPGPCRASALHAWAAARHARLRDGTGAHVGMPLAAAPGHPSLPPRLPPMPAGAAVLQGCQPEGAGAQRGHPLLPPRRRAAAAAVRAPAAVRLQRAACLMACCRMCSRGLALVGARKP